jgi:hypothetical protein
MGGKTIGQMPIAEATGKLARLHPQEMTKEFV